MDVLQPVTSVWDQLERRVAAGQQGLAEAVPTGFRPLDDHLAGGLRGGELALLGGPQGLGKTTFALQAARQAVAAGGAAVVVSYEHGAAGLAVRLLAQEAVAAAGAAAPTLRELVEALERGDVLDGLAGVEQARAALTRYGDRLAVLEASGRSTTLEVVRTAVLSAVEGGRRPLVVVDYLQKVPVGDHLPEQDRITRVVEGLKDLAMEAGVPVLAVVAASSEGIAPGQRLRVHQLRGTSALAYEADVILLLNHKHQIVARQHTAYDPRALERFRLVAVCSLEKNRSGVDGIDMEFRKDFAYGRFDPDGDLVQEQLVDRSSVDG